MRRNAFVLIALGALLAGCGYFNSLYNANRRFAEAEQAASRGDRTGARRAYAESIEKAAVSYRRYPDSRWADDALLLIGRAHFALEDDAAAAAAMRRLLEVTADEHARLEGHALLGAALARSGTPRSALTHLDSAAAGLDASRETGAFARLWRAHAYFALGRAQDAWSDLDQATLHGDIAFDAALAGARHAVALRDSARFAEHMQRLARAEPRARAVTAIADLLDSAAEWNAGIAFNGSAALERASWAPGRVDTVAVARARLAAAAGDTADALRVATRVAESTGAGIGSKARLLGARLLLGQADHPDRLEEIRVLLLPAFDDQDAVALMRDVKAVQILALRGRDPGSALSLFAAAEYARDKLGARELARRLFLDYAALRPDDAWAGKALLAAHVIRADDETRAAIAAARTNPYIRATHGESVAAEIDRAEQRLALGLAGLRSDALAEAAQRDVIVGRAITVLDSTRAAARSDSVRIACAALVDSLSIDGIRADSTRTACLRGDTARVTYVLRVDTTLLRDTTGLDSLEMRSMRQLPDTMQPRTR